jgi:hypothetical protein
MCDAFVVPGDTVAATIDACARDTLPLNAALTIICQNTALRFAFSNGHIEPDAVGVTRVGPHGAVMAPPPGVVAGGGAVAAHESEPDFGASGMYDNIDVE